MFIEIHGRKEMSMSNDRIYDAIKLDDSWFKRQLLKIKRTNDREDAYQAYMVYPIIESALNRIKNCSYELIDTHMFRQGNTEKHDRRGYSSLAIAVPDLIIAENFVYHNRDMDNAKYAVSIEIKTIDSEEMLGKSFSMQTLYNDSILEQLFPQLMRRQSVILTNLRVWEFITVKKNIVIEHLPVYQYYMIIENCGIDVKDDLFAINLKLHKLIELMGISQSNESEDDVEKAIITKLDDLVIFMNEQTFWDKKEREEIEKAAKSPKRLIKQKILGKVVKWAYRKYEKEIKYFFASDCEIDSKRILKNDNAYVIRTNVQKKRSDKKYITSVDDINFDGEINNLSELISCIENFLKKTLNA